MLRRRLFLFPIVIALLGANAISDQRNNPSSLKGDGFTVQSAGQTAPIALAPDLKMHIDAFASPSGSPGCLGPIMVGYITVTNVGNRVCRRPKLATAFGYFPVAGQAVLYQVTSVGAMPATLAPGATVHMLVQNATCLGQKAISQGYFEVNEPVCRGETKKANNKATRVSGTTYNPD